MAEDPRLLDAVEQLIGPNIVLQYSKLNVKPPRVGSVVEWHQDFAYYPHTNTDLVASLIYLDNATRENACLRVVSGSHRHGLLGHESEGYFVGKVSSPADVGLDDSAVVDCEGAAGSVVFIHPLLLHSSEKNLLDSYRRVFIPSYRAADALPIYYGPHAAHNEPTAQLVRGSASRTVRSETGRWQLPIAAAEFNSLYQVQEGSHVTDGTKASTGYFSHEVGAKDTLSSSMCRPRPPCIPDSPHWSMSYKEHHDQLTKRNTCCRLMDPGRQGFNFKPQVAEREMAVISVYTMPREHVRSRWPNHTVGDTVSLYAAELGEIRAQLAGLGADIRAVVPASDVAVDKADILAEKLGLPGNGARLALARRDKSVMRETAAQAGVRVPRYVLAEDADDIARAARAVGFPAFVKQTTGAASHGTRLLNRPQDAEDLPALHRTDHFGRPVQAWLVEQYVRGRELGVNFFSHDGAHQVVDIWEYRQPDDRDYSFPYWDWAQIPQDAPDWHTAVDYVRQVLDAFGVRRPRSHRDEDFGWRRLPH